jgi:hypothetical protein
MLFPEIFKNCLLVICLSKKLVFTSLDIKNPPF